MLSRLSIQSQPNTCYGIDIRLALFPFIIPLAVSFIVLSLSHLCLLGAFSIFCIIFTDLYSATCTDLVLDSSYHVRKRCNSIMALFVCLSVSCWSERWEWHLLNLVGLRSESTKSVQSIGHVCWHTPSSEHFQAGRAKRHGPEEFISKFAAHIFFGQCAGNWYKILVLRRTKPHHPKSRQHSNQQLLHSRCF